MSPRNKKLNEKMRMETKTKIIDAALEVFSGYGFHGTTMNQIAKHTGLSNGLIYHYFPSKEKLFYYLVDSALEISRKAWTDAIDSPGTPLEKIKILTENLLNITFTPKNSQYLIIMLQAVTQGKSIPGLLEYMHGKSDHFNILPELIVEAQKLKEIKEGDPEVLTATFISLFQGYTIYLYHNKELEKKITVDIFMNIFK